MPPLLLFKFGRKASATSWSIALCTMFIVAGFAVAEGLSTSTENLASNFSSEYSLVTKKGSSGPGLFDSTELPVNEIYAFGILVEALVNETDAVVTVFAVRDPGHVLKETLDAPDGAVLVAQGESYPSSIRLTAETSVVVSVSGRYSSTMFPSSWLLGGEALVRQLSGFSEGYRFAIAKGLSDVAASSLVSNGYAVQPLVGIVEFLSSGVEEIKSDAMWVLLPSMFVVAVLAYGFMSSETSDRRHDIGIVKTIGAGRRRILWMLTLNAVVVSAWGGLLGLALGVVLSYGTSTVASSIFSSVFVIKASGWMLAFSYATTVGAAVVGAVLPALSMTFSKPVEDLKEGVRYS